MTQNNKTVCFLGSCISFSVRLGNSNSLNRARKFSCSTLSCTLWSSRFCRCIAPSPSNSRTPGRCPCTPGQSRRREGRTGSSSCNVRSCRLCCGRTPPWWPTRGNAGGSRSKQHTKKTRLIRSEMRHMNVKNKSYASPTGNQTPVARVTGGDTYHYTIEDWPYMCARLLLRMGLPPHQGKILPPYSKPDLRTPSTPKIFFDSPNPKLAKIYGF